MRYLLILSVLISVSCKQHSQDDHIPLNRNISKLLDEYISKTPLQMPIQAKLYENGFSYPSYQIFFDKKNRDTLLYFVRVAHFNDIKPYSHIGDENDMEYEITQAKGSLLYKDKFPITIFDEKSLGDKFYDEKNLSKVPDTLKLNEKNYHVTPNMKTYILKNGYFQ